MFLVPEKVLREEPGAPCYHNLQHSALNIEIRPWKVSEVRTSVTTEVIPSETDDTTTMDDEKTDETVSVDDHVHDPNADLVPLASDSRQDKTSTARTSHGQRDLSDEDFYVDLGPESQATNEEDSMEEQQESPRTDEKYSESVSGPRDEDLHLQEPVLESNAQQDTAVEEDLSVQIQDSPRKGVVHQEYMISPVMREHRSVLERSDGISDVSGMASGQSTKGTYVSGPSPIEHNAVAQTIATGTFSELSERPSNDDRISIDDSHLETMNSAELNQHNAVAQMVGESITSEDAGSIRKGVRPKEDEIGSRAMTDKTEEQFVNQHNTVAQGIAARMLFELSKGSKSDGSTTMTNRAPEDSDPEYADSESSGSAKKRDQTDAALVHSDDAHSPPKMQKVSGNHKPEAKPSEHSKDETDTAKCVESDVSKTPMTRKLEDHDGTLSDMPEKVRKLDRAASLHQHTDLAQVLETFEDRPTGTTVHVMHQVECIVEEPERELQESGTSAVGTIGVPTSYDIIISTDDEEGTSVDPQDHIPREGRVPSRDQTDLAPVDSDGPSRPVSVVKGSSGITKREALVTIEETEMLEKVITQDRASGLIGVDEVDKTNVDSDEEDAEKVSKKEKDISIPGENKEDRDENSNILSRSECEDDSPGSLDAEQGLGLVSDQHGEHRPIAAVQPQVAPMQSIRTTHVPDVNSAAAHSAEIPAETTGLNQTRVVPEVHNSEDNMSTARTSHGPEHLTDQGLEDGRTNLENIIAAAEEDVCVELQGSPRKGVEHTEHVASPRARNLLHQPVVVKEAPAKTKSESLRNGRQQVGSSEEDEDSYDVFEGARLSDRKQTDSSEDEKDDSYGAVTGSRLADAPVTRHGEITEEELEPYRGAGVRGRSVTPMRTARPGSNRRSRSLSPHALEDAFFKMAEADSGKNLVESAIQTDPLSSRSSSTKSSPKRSAQKIKDSTTLTRRESSDNTSRSVSPIDSSSESSALVQQALATIRSAMGTQSHQHSSKNKKQGSDELSVRDRQVIGRTVQENEDEEVLSRKRRMESVGLQTGDSLDDLPGASAAPSGGEISDQVFERELEHSSVLLQDLDSSTTSENEMVITLEPRENLGAEEVVDDRQPSLRVLKSSTPTTSTQHLNEIVVPVTEDEIQGKSLNVGASGRTRDQASGLDVEVYQDGLEGTQESFESPENSEATTVVSVSVGRVDPIQSIACAAPAQPNVAPEVLEAASGQRSFAVQAGESDEDSAVLPTSLNSVTDLIEEQRSMPVQAAGSADEEVSPEQSDDAVDSRTQHRSFGTQASESNADINAVQDARSFGVQATGPNDPRPDGGESDGDQLLRSFGVQVAQTDNVQPVDNRMSSISLESESSVGPPDMSHSSSRQDADDMNISRSSYSDRSLHAAQTRTIETQTYPDLRVIETQTSMEVHGMETQTSPKQLVEGEATQTEANAMEEISVQTPVEMITSGMYCILEVII